MKRHTMQRIVLAGSPGAGKSTLLIQIMCQLASSYSALYITGEESLAQIAMRAKRLGLPMGDLKAKFSAFGWHVMEMDGGNIENVIETLQNAKTHTGNGKPIVILMTTVMGNGVDYMMHTHKWHGVAPNDEELERALVQLTETIGDY